MFGKIELEKDELIQELQSVGKVNILSYSKMIKIFMIDNIKVDVPSHKWDKRLCEKCNELTVAEYGYYINDQFLCAGCSEMTIGHLGHRRSLSILEN